VLSTSVVGRDGELASLRGLVDAAVHGRGGAAFLSGPAGIGKSRLAQEAAAAAQRRGCAVLRGRAVQAATPVAYRPLTEALCSAIRSGEVPDEAELSPFRRVLGRVVPDWSAGAEARVDDSVVALSEAVLRLLRAVAGDRGCLLVLEDLHWADPETLAIVEYVADNLTTEGVVLVGAVRSEEPSDAVDLARRLASRRVGRLVELGPLHEHDVTAMVRSCLASDDVPDEVLAFAGRAEGVPFLVEELLATAVASGVLVDDGQSWELAPVVERVIPLTFADSMARRMSVLGRDARRVLEAAAVLGRRFDWKLLPAVADLEESAVLAALHDAVDAQIVAVEADGLTFRFRHALSRDAVLAKLLPPERAALCRRAFEEITASDRELDEGQCELAAELAERAGERSRAAALLLEVGRRALHAGALASAETALDRARALAAGDDPVIVDVEECLSEVLSLAGKRDRAVEIGKSLLARLGDDPGAPARRAEAHLRLSRAASAATRWPEAAASLAQARVHAAQADDEVLGSRADALGALVALGAGDREAAARLARAALAVAERMDVPEVACQALEVIGRCERPRDLDAAAAAFRTAYDVAGAHGLTLWRVRALHELGTIDLLAGGDAARLEEARQLALSQGALATAAVLDVQTAAALVMQDDAELALAPARRAAALARRYGLEQTLSVALGFEAHVHARAGRRDVMEACLRQAEALGGGSPDLAVVAAMARTYLALVDEDRIEAERQLDLAIVHASRPAGDQSSPVPGFWALVRAVRPDAPAELPLTNDDPVHFLARSYARYARAVEAGRAGDDGGARALVAEGDRLLGASTWFRHYGRRLVAEAAIDDGWGDPVTWLREALVFFEDRGEDRIVSVCRSLLRRAGAPVSRRGRGVSTVPADLRALGVTSREVDVLTLVADGLPNREIAERLVVSPRTVEAHVERLLTKTGASNRRELAQVATRTGVGARGLT
jgi:DNA-binding CsgD family transcriptional regulator